MTITESAKMLDYITPQERINPQPATLEQKRELALKNLKARGKWLMDPTAKWRTGEAWRPAPACDTDVRRTWADAEMADMLAMDQ
jgi:hypothetical protein